MNELGDTYGDDVVEVFLSYERALWACTLIFFVGGDIVTTVAGLVLKPDSVVETGPLAAPLLEVFPLGAIIPLKLLTIAICYGLFKLVPRPHSVGVPLGLGTLGALVTAWNLVIVFAAFT